MAKNVHMSTKGVEVFSEEIAPVFEIREEKTLLGRLTVSTGGVRWAPAWTRGDAFFLNWETFDDLMKQQKRG